MINDELRKIVDKIKYTDQPNPLLNEILYRLRFHRVLLFFAGLKLRKLRGKCKSFEDYLNLLASFHFSFFNRTSYVILRSMQRKSEIRKFCKILWKIRPKIVLEIGTAEGGTLFLLTRLSDPNALILSIDLSGKKKTYREVFYHSFAIDNQKIIFLERDSHKLSTLEELKKILRNRQIDVLFIDGDHSYEGVKKDFEMYSPLVKKNGIIGFHDIVVISPDRFPDVEVNKFWNEIKKNYEYQELVEDWNQEWGGIGVIKIQ
ncbi:MAG: class I SAM-dependent methyltransferase [Promethearchaeota archaeon]